LRVKVGPAGFWPEIDKNSLWTELNLQKGQLSVKGILAQFWHKIASSNSPYFLPKLQVSV